LNQNRLEENLNEYLHNLGSMFSSSGGNPDLKKYKQIDMRIRQTVLERAKYRCQTCSIKFTPNIQPKFQHVNGSIKDNRPVNLKALCSTCFKLVEKNERVDPLTRVQNIMKKVFNKK